MQTQNDSKKQVGEKVPESESVGLRQGGRDLHHVTDKKRTMETGEDGDTCIFCLSTFASPEISLCNMFFSLKKKSATQPVSTSDCSSSTGHLGLAPEGSISQQASM